ncbi:hypothetical protein HZC32_01845 [Candidatus Woesearchaeota archaeon]|nr:hypothetical protein [Candidatus Woesearchaeota archaeon]
MKSTRKAQLHISETIAVLFIFFILIIFGIVFYYKYQQVALKEEHQKLLADRAIVTTLKVLYSPELKCTKQKAVPEEYCIDMMKLRQANDTFYKHTNDYYFDLFSYAKIKVVEIYPNPRNWTLYDKKLLNKSTDILMSNKKSQMEMIGLVIIVILLTLGMLFMARFALSEEKGKKIFTDTGLASSTLGALAQTTVNDPNCVKDYEGKSNPSLEKELLEDCANNYETRLDCNCEYSHYCCGNTHSCCFLNQTVTLFLNQTLGTWSKHYHFRSKLILSDAQEETLLDIKDKSSKGCSGLRDKISSKPFPLQTDLGLVMSELLLCD